MASIIVNDSYCIKGHLSISRQKEVNEEGEEVLVSEGVLKCHLYFEDIRTLEMPRLKILDINVVREEFGSDDFLMCYYFSFEDLDFSGVYNKALEAYSYLTIDEVEQIEAIVFEDDTDILGGVTKEYPMLKDIIKRNEDIADLGGEEENE